MKIAKDKKLHFIAGMIIALISIPVTLYSDLSDLCIMLPVIIIGAAKELIWDLWWKKGCFEWLDFFATVLGGIVMYLILLLF